MKWEKKKLCECTEYITDGDHQPAPKADKGVHFIKIKDIVNNQVSFDAQVYVPQEYYDNLPMERKPQKEDVLYTVVGSFGIPSYVQTDELFCFERNIALLHPNKDIEPRFLYYSLKNPAFYKGVEIVANGSAQKLIPLSKLKDLKILVPDKEAQRHIADILSAYDDLIENNQKQIKLLEEAAQRLYKEWFVNLRFPGHENTKIVDGVPEGWRISSIYDVFDIKYGKNLPTSKITKVGQYPVYGASGVIGYYNEKNCDDYVTLVTSRGNGSGDVFRTHHKQSYVTNNSFIARRNDKNIFIKNEFTFQLFSNTDFKKLCTGSAQPQLTNTSIQKIKIFLPNRQLIEKYQRCTIEMSEKQEVLYKEQRALTQARNRLLSKLINGTVEV